LEESPTLPHPDRPRHFERARTNSLWHTDLSGKGAPAGWSSGRLWSRCQPQPS